jgi:hypothetical protein
MTGKSLNDGKFNTYGHRYSEDSVAVMRRASYVKRITVSQGPRA